MNGNEFGFSNGMNFIIGANGSGKTTFFNLIMHVLGLKDIKRTTDFIRVDGIVVNCTIGDLQVSITRDNENKIHFNGGIKIEAKYGSRELQSIYNSLFEPTFDFEEDTFAAQEILESSFISENHLYSDVLLQKTYNKILGVNIDYIKSYKKQINLYKQKISNEDSVHITLKTFINNVEKDLENNSSKDEISSVLRKHYISLYDSIFENRKLLDEALEMYNYVSKIQESTMKERKEVVDKQIKDYNHSLGISREESIYSSGGMNILRKFIPNIARTKKYPDYKYLNTNGFLITDSPFGGLDTNSTNTLRNIILDECKNRRLQYIEFTSFNSGIPSNANIIHLNYKEAIGWLRVN
ncbi:AAA family ATPase [Paenibacillus dokdonensis]|uniref:AAA family ATPase n=1 Tax=Paenibacillus dokdonensis TaxID=2567944 RepID=UPI003D278120